MALLETPPGEGLPPVQQPVQPPEDQAPEVAAQGRRGRYNALDHHELIMLLDEVDDERARARFREAVYIAIILWMVFSFAVAYLPRFLPKRPVLIVSPERNPKEMTYLDVPPNLQKELRQRPAPHISSHSTEAQSPHPVPQQAPQAKAGAPAPPIQQPQPAPPAPQPAPQPQQQARNTPPAPKPQPAPPIDIPAPQPQVPARRPNFGTQSASQAIQEAARNARSGGSGESGEYGSAPRSQTGAGKTGVQVLSDTQGVDFGKYLERLLRDVKRNWLPLIPEECRSPINKQGITGVRFTILPDGRITGMQIDYSTHDDAINRAAWGSITALGAAQPLPKEFHGPNLELRIEFRINKDAPDAQ